MIQSFLIKTGFMLLFIVAVPLIWVLVLIDKKNEAKRAKYGRS
jgi:high-affinity Fe2+/Pb2+ permease